MRMGTKQQTTIDEPITVVNNTQDEHKKPIEKGQHVEEGTSINENKHYTSANTGLTGNHQDDILNNPIQITGVKENYNMVTTGVTEYINVAT